MMCVIRQSNRDRPLLAPKTSETERLSQQQQQDMERMKMFVQLRQDLERVRNLCYMVSRREKLSRSYFRFREQTFHKQVAVMSCNTAYVETLSSSELDAIRRANHAANIYDITYSAPRPETQNCTTDEFNKILQLIGKLGPDSTSQTNRKVRSAFSSSNLAHGCTDCRFWRRTKMDWSVEETLAQLPATTHTNELT